MSIESLSRLKRAIEKFPLLFFLVTLVIGLFLFHDYGVSWDEPIQRELGNANWNYVLRGDDSLFHLINQYHGPFIEVVEILPEKLFNLQSEKSVFLSRHLINYFIFWLGSVFLFLLGNEIFKNRWWALLAVFMLYLTPRIFAQSFYNSKDIPLLAFFIIGNYFTLIFLRRPSYSLAFLLALVSGMLFAIRVVGIVVPVLTVSLFIFNLLNRNLSTSRLKFLFLFVILVPFFSISFYPVLWHNPIEGVERSFTIFSHYFYDDLQFFMGRLIRPQEIPWFYIPVWMGITIPPVWQLFFFAGFIAAIIFLLREAKNIFKNSIPELHLLAWLLVPWLTIVFLRSPVYDEWRHLFFIYPAFILITVAGIKKLIDAASNVVKRFSRDVVTQILKASMIALVSIQSIFVLQFMIANHPFENVYFNSFAGKQPEKKFDLDYWGLSYRQGLAYLVQHTKQDQINVSWQNAPGNYNLIWLNEDERKRIRETSFDSCNYFLTNFRFHPDQYNDTAWHSIRVSDVSILAIEKLR